jgi:hypothetical protein
MSRPLLGPTNLPIQWVLWFFPRLKCPGYEVDHFPPFSAEVMNEWSFASALLACLHGVDRDKFEVPFIIIILYIYILLLYHLEQTGEIQLN